MPARPIDAPHAACARRDACTSGRGSPSKALNLRLQGKAERVASDARRPEDLRMMAGFGRPRRRHDARRSIGPGRGRRRASEGCDQSRAPPHEPVLRHRARG